MIVAPQLSSGWQHNYSTKTRQAGWANKQSMYSLMSVENTLSYMPVASVTKKKLENRDTWWSKMFLLLPMESRKSRFTG